MSKPPITRHSTSTREVASKLRITQESGRALGGGGEGVYGLQRKITSIMSDGHRGQTGLMDLKTPPRPCLYFQRGQADSIMLVGETIPRYLHFAFRNLGQEFSHLLFLFVVSRDNMSSSLIRNRSTTSFAIKLQ
jgi:hypothetical protein